ncbi:MAG: MurR/RpiR family transcriptional regulator [Trueperaceae bacterium]|nr:MAG: MurR/RpiR family transcriptional regulator [Trueperaceae bacterium]
MTQQTTQERGTLSVISNALPKLRGITRRVAEFVLNAPQETINLTITELGDRVGVSEASIVRFAQSLGYSGFQALKIRLAEDIVSPMLIVHEDLSPDDDPSVAVQKAMTVGLRSVEDTMRILDMTLLDATIEALCGARQINLFATGNSTPIAIDLDFRLTKIGLNSRFTVDTTLQQMHAALTGPTDVALGISHTGSSKDTVYALQLAKDRGATTVAITNHSDSPLTRFGDICLFTSTRIGHFREERLDSNLAMLALTEALFVGILVEHSDATTRAVSKTLRAIEHHKY